MDTVILISGDICEVTFVSDGNLFASFCEKYFVLSVIKPGTGKHFFCVNENK